VKLVLFTKNNPCADDDQLVGNLIANFFVYMRAGVNLNSFLEKVFGSPIVVVFYFSAERSYIYSEKSSVVDSRETDLVFIGERMQITLSVDRRPLTSRTEDLSAFKERAPFVF